MSEQRVVVIGAGIAGCSVAYHLAELGVTDVKVFDKSLASPLGWRSSVDWQTIWANEPHPLRNYADTWYRAVAAEAGRGIGRQTPGRVFYTHLPERWERLQAFPARMRSRQLHVELLSPAEIGERLPLDVTGLIGGLWIPGDARISAHVARPVLISVARARGAIFHEIEVRGIHLSHGEISGIDTATGSVQCDVVILAAGAASADLARSCGLALPASAAERHYVLSQPCGMAADLPLFAAFDDEISGSEHAGGLIFGNHRHTVAGSSDVLSPRTRVGLDELPAYLQRALGRFPALRTLPLEILSDEPETFTPDGAPLLGPVAGATRLYACCGFNANGMSLAPAAGRHLAEWIVDGYASVAMTQFDVRRFTAPQADAAYLRERVAEVLSFRYRVPAADHSFRSARNVCCSPLHDRLLAAGARFAPVNAWERAQWVSPAADADWGTAVAAELHAALTAVLVVDRSADTKSALLGPDAVNWFNAAAPLWLRGSLKTTVDMRPLSSRSGRIEALVRIETHGPDCVSLSATPEQETRVQEWIRNTELPAGFHFQGSSADYALLEFYGPQRHALLSAQNRAGLISAATYMREDTFTDSTVLALPVASAPSVWDGLMAAGPEHGLMVGGHFAEEALRIWRGLPAYGRELTPLTTIGELRAMATGEDEPQWEAFRNNTPGTRVLGAFSSPITVPGFGGGDLLLAGERPIGVVTSRVRIPGWRYGLALGILDFSLWRGEKLHFVAHGATWPLTPRESPWHVELRRGRTS